MRIVNIVIAASTVHLLEGAPMTNQQMTERGWILFNENAMARIVALELNMAQVQADIGQMQGTLNLIVQHLGIVLNH